MVRTHGVEHDQEHVGRSGRGQGAAGFAPLLEPVSSKHETRQDQNQSQQAGKSLQERPPQAGCMPLEPRNQKRRNPQGEDQPGLRIDLGTADHEHRQDGEGAENAWAEPPRSPRPTLRCQPPGRLRSRKTGADPPGEPARRNAGSCRRAGRSRRCTWQSTLAPTSSNPAASPHQRDSTSTSRGPSRRRWPAIGPHRARRHFSRFESSWLIVSSWRRVRGIHRPTRVGQHASCKPGGRTFPEKPTCSLPEINKAPPDTIADVRGVQANQLGWTAGPGSWRRDIESRIPKCGGDPFGCSDQDLAQVLVYITRRTSRSDPSRMRPGGTSKMVPCNRKRSPRVA